MRFCISMRVSAENPEPWARQWFRRLGFPKGPPVQGCLRTRNTTERLKRPHSGEMRERVCVRARGPKRQKCSGPLQLRARRACTVTFPPYRLSTSITREGTRFITLKISWRDCRERQNKAAGEGGGRGALTAISSSSELSFSWMAVNPPCSPNWGGGKQAQMVKRRATTRTMVSESPLAGG